MQYVRQEGASSAIKVSLATGDVLVHPGVGRNADTGLQRPEFASDVQDILAGPHVKEVVSIFPYFSNSSKSLDRARALYKGCLRRR